MSSKNYTFHVYCSFKIQYTFTEDEVDRDPGGDETDFEPTDEALQALEHELQEFLGENYVIDDVDASADSNSFIAAEEDEK